MVKSKPIGKKHPHMPVSPLLLCSLGMEVLLWVVVPVPPTPSVRALIPAAALPQVSQLRAWHHLRAHLSHASLLQEFGQHLVISLVAPFLTRCSQRMSRIKLRLCQAQCEITSSG